MEWLLWGCGRAGPARVPGVAAGSTAAGVRPFVVVVSLGRWSGGVEGLEPVPGADEIVGPVPTVGDLQDSAAGMLHDPGGDGEESESQGLRLGEPQVTVEGEVPQPRGHGDGERGELQPGRVPALVGGGQLLRARRLQLFDLVLDVGLGPVPGVEPLELPADGVGCERAVAPFRVLIQGGLLARRAGGAGDDDPQIGRPAVEPVTVGLVPQQPGQVGDLLARGGPPVGGQPGGPRRLGQGGVKWSV
jgi:hypothetical protein